MDFAALPPEVNSTRMYTGPGSGPLLAAATAWDGLAAELRATAASCQAVVSRLIAESWLGPSAQAMAAAASPYVAWLTATAQQAEQTAHQAKSAAAAYETAFAMTVPPSVVAANRAQLLTLVATNFLGQNTAAIAATEAHYSQMWAQDATAMYGYAGSSAPAVQLAPFTNPPKTGDPAGPAQQAAAVGKDIGSSAGSTAQQAMSQLGSATAGAPPQPIAPQAAPVAPPPMPFPAEIAVPDVLGLNALAVAGVAVSDAGLALSGGAWWSADESTVEILHQQDQLYVIQHHILDAIDLYSPLTPSRPHGFVAGVTSALSATVGEAVTVGNLSVPMSWAAAAPEVRSLSYTTPLAGTPAAAPAVASASMGGLGTAFSQMALAGMGGSALAGSVSRGRPNSVEAPQVGRVGKPPEPVEEADNPVTGIAAEIKEFAELRDRGLITDEEYSEQKQRLLGR